MHCASPFETFSHLFDQFELALPGHRHSRRPDYLTLVVGVTSISPVVDYIHVVTPNVM
jgi:hypothetical protein